MAQKILQKHMQGFTQNLIEGKLEPKELGFNETLRQGVYKHDDGTTIDIYPSENKLSKTVTPSGGSLIGVASAAFTVLSATNDQSLWAEVDAQLSTVLGNYVVSDGSKGAQTVQNNLTLQGTYKVDTDSGGSAWGLEITTSQGGNGIQMIDSLRDISTNVLKIRMRTAGTPVDAVSIFGDGTTEFGGNVKLLGDTRRLFWGEGQDATAYYDGTDLIIDPKEVGSGNLKLLSNIDLNNNDLLNVSDIDISGDTISNDGTNLVLNPANNVEIQSDLKFIANARGIVLGPTEEARIDFNGGALDLDAGGAAGGVRLDGVALFEHAVRFNDATISGADTITDSETVSFAVAGTYTITMPTPSGKNGQLHIVNRGSGAGTITINGTTLTSDNESLMMISDGTNWINIYRGAV